MALAGGDRYLLPSPRIVFLKTRSKLKGKKEVCEIIM
jgi:hypothetical protein